MKRLILVCSLILVACVGDPALEWVTNTPEMTPGVGAITQPSILETETPPTTQIPATALRTPNFTSTPDATNTPRLTPTRICDQPEGCDFTPAPTSTFQGPVTRGFVKSNLSYLRVRSGPGLTFPVIDSYSPGVAVDCYDIESDWCQTSKGWVSVEFLELPE